MGSVTRRVVTFYSFKGGVGRTFALCDVAVYLARWGYRVLCVDLDLEAPGLGRYFDEWLKDDDRPGMLEILETWANDASDETISAEVIQPVSLPGINGRLALVKSGRRGATTSDGCMRWTGSACSTSSGPVAASRRSASAGSITSTSY